MTMAGVKCLFQAVQLAVQPHTQTDPIKFYLEVIQGELGISEKIKGNSVYKPVNQNIDNIIEKHVVSIKNDFNINIKEVNKNIPLLYWVSKQHRNP